jgi:hypothetical protein
VDDVAFELEDPLDPRGEPLVVVDEENVRPREAGSPPSGRRYDGRAMAAGVSDG